MLTVRCFIKSVLVMLNRQFSFTFCSESHYSSSSSSLLSFLWRRGVPCLHEQAIQAFVRTESFCLSQSPIFFVKFSIFISFHYFHPWFFSFPLGSFGTSLLNYHPLCIGHFNCGSHCSTLHIVNLIPFVLTSFNAFVLHHSFIVLPI